MAWLTRTRLTDVREFLGGSGSRHSSHRPGGWKQSVKSRISAAPACDTIPAPSGVTSTWGSLVVLSNLGMPLRTAILVGRQAPGISACRDYRLEGPRLALLHRRAPGLPWVPGITRSVCRTSGPVGISSVPSRASPSSPVQEGNGPPSPAAGCSALSQALAACPALRGAVQRSPRLSGAGV